MAEDIEKRPSGHDLLNVVEHWMVETIAAFLQGAEYEHAIAMTAMLKQLRCDFGMPSTVVKKAHPFSLTATEKGLIMAGSPINAIKEVRSRTGLPLKAAKDLVDAFRSHHFKDLKSGSTSYGGGSGGAFAGLVDAAGFISAEADVASAIAAST